MSNPAAPKVSNPSRHPNLQRAPGVDPEKDGPNPFGPDAPNVRPDDPPGGQAAPKANPPTPPVDLLEDDDFAPDEP